MGCGSSQGSIVIDSRQPVKGGVGSREPQEKAVQKPPYRPPYPESPRPSPSHHSPYQDPSDPDHAEPGPPFADTGATEHFQAFVEFPTFHLLREANAMYASLGRRLPRAEDGSLLPYPTPTPKVTVFDLSKFQKLDNFAISVDVSHTKKTLQDFTMYLVKNCGGAQLDIARVIFRWLAAQDIAMYGQLTPESQSSTEWHLQRLKSSPGNYATVYRDMCRFAGLQAETIRGHAKHAHLEPGEDPKSDELNTWVGVVINNEWRLVDPHWGSSHMVGTDPGEYMLLDDNGEGQRHVAKNVLGTAYEYDEKYFLTDPEQYIYSHIPVNDEKMQFLARPVTLREFVQLAYLKPGFFELGLRLLEHRKCVLYASEGEIDLQIGTPRGQQRSFMYRLWISNKQSVNDIKLDRFCIMQQKNDVLYCRIFFPVPGKYKIELFARDSENKGEDSSMHKFVCAYVIHSDKAAEDVKSFPENKRSEWGPGPELEAAGLHPLTHDDALIEAEDGTATIRFSTDRAVEVLTQLHSNSKSKDELKNYVVHYVDEKNGEVVAKLKLPESGDYALNVFAKDEGKQGSLTNVCSYIVSCENAASDATPYPEITNGRLGRLVGNAEVRLSLMSHESPLIQCPDTGELNLEFLSTVACDTMTGLELCSNGSSVKKEDLVWTTHDGKQINNNIRFPEPGVYTFNVYAKEAGKEGSFPHVYTCMITVPIPMTDCKPFPKAYAQWTPECTILEPSIGILPANSKIKFSAKIPHAVYVTTIGSNGWYSLQRGEDGVWTGEAETPAVGEQLKLSAKVDEGSNTYSTVLMYQTEEVKDLEEEERRQRELQEAAKREQKLRERKEQELQERRKKDFERTKAALLAAIKSRDLSALRKALKDVENKKYVSRLRDNVEMARSLIKSLERIRELKDAVVNMDQNTMLEIRNYASPPELVHEVMKATLLILGDSERKTREWPECQKKLGTLGKDGLSRRVHTFDVTALHPEIAARALEIVGRYRLDDVREVSAGAGRFYAWAVGMIEELRVTSPHALRASPASKTRQREIFGKNKGKG